MIEVCTAVPPNKAMHLSALHAAGDRQVWGDSMVATRGVLSTSGRQQHEHWEARVMDHTESLIKAFIRPERAERYLALLRKRDGRGKLRAQLAHLRDLDPRFTRSLEGAAATPERIERLLQAAGAPAICYAFSEDDELDGRELELHTALNEVVGRGMGTFLSCIPGRLAYFEGEGPKERYLLSRSAV
jgi:hypothetical protein